MSSLILGAGAHRSRLRSLFEGTDGLVRVASAYVTDTDPLLAKCNREVHLLTALATMDIVSGATSLAFLGKLIKRGVKCCVLPGSPRLHAKVYIFGANCAVVTSANFTGSAMDHNIEVGVLVDGNDAQRLGQWFDRQWQGAKTLDLAQLSTIGDETAILRKEFSRIRNRCRSHKPKHPSRGDRGGFANTASEAAAYFLCNTDRAHSTRSRVAGFEREELMKANHYALA